jgi:two-component system, chemotaxis family, sensor kinase CheA
MPHTKNNRRTLRKRVRRLMYFSTLINILVFGVILLVIVTQMFRPLSETAAKFIGSSIARDMNSPAFLNQFGIAGLEQFDPAADSAKQWMKTHLEDVATQEKFIYAMHRDEHGVWGEKRHDIILLEVRIQDRVLFSNVQDVTSTLGETGPWVSKIVELYNIESKHSLVDAQGETIGSVTAGINPLVGFGLLMAAVASLLLLIIVVLFLSKLVSSLFTLPIIAPIDQLECTMKSLASGEDVETTISSTVKLKRPLREIESLIDSTNTIMGKMKSYTELMRDQNEELEAQKLELESQRDEMEAQRDELEAQKEELLRSQEHIQEAKRKLALQEKSLRSLLNNAGQGFLSFGADLRVREEYSLECVKLFGAGLASRPFPELIAPADAEQMTFLRNLLSKLFQETEPAKRGLYVPLLIDEIQIDNRHIQLEYKMIPETEPGDGESCMVILTDVTEKRLLQSQMEQERNTLKMVVKVVVGYNDYSELVREYKEFTGERVNALFSEEVPLDAALFELFRQLHTFKGNFAQYGLTYAVDQLHEAENIVAELCKASDTQSLEEVRSVLAGFRMGEWLEPELEVLQSFLGDTFFGQDNVLFIDKTKIVEIEKKMVATLSTADCQVLLPELRKLRFKPFKELLRSYPEYTAGLAERLDKMIEPFEIEGDEVLCDSEKYADFARSLVHVFRNMADHGIECCNEREAQGKPELGRIRCEVRQEENTIRVTVSDDGRGISAELVKAKAIAKGLIVDEAAAAMSEETLREFIFHEQLSTKEDITELSGRGIGLSAVKLETERLGGTVEVATEVGQGTSFTFRLPFEAVSEVPQLEAVSMMTPLAETAKQFFREQVGHSLDAQTPFQLSAEDKVSLRNITTFIGVKGALEGRFVLTMDESLASATVRSLVYGSLSDEEELQLAEDTLAEASNIILGNSISRFPELEPYIVIEPPITLQTRGASVKYADAAIWTCRMACGAGALQLSLILTRKPDLS